MVGGGFQGNGTLALLGHAEHGMISSKRVVGGGFQGNERENVTSNETKNIMSEI